MKNETDNKYPKLSKLRKGCAPEDQYPMTIHIPSGPVIVGSKATHDMLLSYGEKCFKEASVVGGRRSGKTFAALAATRVQLAEAFRNAPASTSHNHVDVYNAIEAIGGRAAIAYGRYVATPFRNRWQKRDRGLAVADALEDLK